MSMADRHLKCMTQFMIESEKLPTEWSKILPDLVRSSGTLLRGCKGMDQNTLQGLKVKRIVGGVSEESVCLRGVVFTKNIVHKKMTDDVRNPRVLLLGCSIEYERNQRFSQLANLAQLEREYFRIAVGRIVHQVCRI